jgi:hypothetical protein
MFLILTRGEPEIKLFILSSFFLLQTTTTNFELSRAIQRARIFGTKSSINYHMCRVTKC